MLSLDGHIVGFFDLPGRVPETFGEPIVDRYTCSFRCAAVGVRMDELGKALAARAFWYRVYYAFLAAPAREYEYLGTSVPWDQHPYLPKPFADYASVVACKPIVDGEGNDRFLLKCQLKQALETLVSEGASSPLPS